MTAIPHLPDDAHISRIAQALWSRTSTGDAAVLVGAGFGANAVPMRAGLVRMPSWDGLTRAIVRVLLPSSDAETVSSRELLERQVGTTSTSIRLAQEFESAFGRDALDQLIRDTIPDQHFAPAELHQLLLKLPWADVLTTNWDTLLERGADLLEDRVYEVVRTVQDIPTARPPRIVKLHGTLPSQRPFIFTEEDFRTYPNRFAPFVNLARQTTMENALVLLGFSGDDPNFLFWSGWVRDELGSHAPTIYLVGVLGLTPSRRKMLEDRRVQPVDLAHLPEAVIGVGVKRHGLAARWFLERLQMAEPYRGRRWPRIAAPPDPTPTLLTTAIDRPGPLDEPVVPDGGEEGISVARHVVPIWRHNRALYPGWIVAPADVRHLVWEHTKRFIPEILDGISVMSWSEALEALYELNWRYELALVPVGFDLAEPLCAFVSQLIVSGERLANHQLAQLHTLVFAVLRHAREEGDEVLFNRWASWLEPRVTDQPDERARLTYERCLMSRASFDVNALEAAVSAWRIEGDAFWLVRKAGLLAELGHHDDADRLSKEALLELRRRTLKGSDDIFSWSRESYALLLRSAYLMGRMSGVGGPFDEATWRQQDERQDLLASRGCDGNGEFFGFVSNLGHVPTPLRQQTERQPRFDIGQEGVNHQLDPPHPLLLRLVGFQAIRFQEESGLPSNVEHVVLSGQFVQRAAEWLRDVAPFRAVTAFLQVCRGHTGEAFERILSRDTVAKLNEQQASLLTQRLLRFISAMVPRLPSRKQQASVPHVRLRVAIESLSRVTLRAAAHASEALDAACAVYRDSTVARSHGLDDCIERLIARSFEAMSVDGRSVRCPSLFGLPLPGESGYANQQVDPVARILVSRATSNGAASDWAPIVEQLIVATSSEATRPAAVARLVQLNRGLVLTGEQQRAFAEALWHAAFIHDGLPGGTRLRRWDFAHLPQPDGRSVAGVLRALVTDASFSLASDENLSLAWAVANDSMASTLELNDHERRRLLLQFKDWILSLTLAESVWPLDGADEFRMRASQAFGAFAEFAVSVEGGRDIIEEIFKQRRAPWSEGALPALVAMKLIDAFAAVQALRTALLGELVQPAQLAAQGTVAWTRRAAPSEVLAELWENIGLAVVARRPATLVPAIQVAGIGYRKYAEVMPERLDHLVCQGLDRVLVESDPTTRSLEQGYDLDRARLWGAVLVATMNARQRGDARVLQAWRDAASSDPLGDIRRGFAMAQDLAAESWMTAN